MRRSAGVAHGAWWVGAAGAVVVVVLHVVIVGWAVPVAATERWPGSPHPPSRPTCLRRLPLGRIATPRDADEGLWLSWSLVDTARERRVGSANSGTERTNSESSIKAWIAADYLRVAQAEGRAVTAAERADIAATVRSSDNAATQRLYSALGGDAILRDLRFGLRRGRLDLGPGILVADPDHCGGRHADLRLRAAHGAGRCRAGTIS